MNTYRIHWKHGDTQDIKGFDQADACNKAGIGRGAVYAMDYIEHIGPYSEKQVFINFTQKDIEYMTHLLSTQDKPDQLLLKKLQASIH